jgi:hypothetical protein
MGISGRSVIVSDYTAQTISPALPKWYLHPTDPYSSSILA